ncbi:MAG TPA: hypothetical protein QF753_21630 [Victivallales bacterium]|nr:hypothetical protein [Victivallales bacterium]
MSKKSLILAGYYYSNDFYKKKDAYKTKGIWFKYNSYKEEYIGET